MCVCVCVHVHVYMCVFVCVHVRGWVGRWCVGVCVCVVYCEYPIMLQWVLSSLHKDSEYDGAQEMNNRTANYIIAIHCLYQHYTTQHGPPTGWVNIH